MGSGVAKEKAQPASGAKGNRSGWITNAVVRAKNPEVDLRKKYGRVMQICMGISLVLHVSIATAFPEFKPSTKKIQKAQRVIEVQDIPETQQIKRPPPPPRPAVPIETESADVPDDVTIESTDLALDEAPIDLPPPPPPGSQTEGQVEDEIVEFFAVEQEPKQTKQVSPEYPEVARKAGLEGTVFVQFVVGKDGHVRDAVVLKGPQIFHDAALAAVYKFAFKPAIQNDKPVSVRMTQAIRFRLTGGQ